MGNAIAVTQQPGSKEETLASPYLVARREWDERYGGLIRRAQQWRGAAILALLVALVEAIIIIGVATRPRATPYSLNSCLTAAKLYDGKLQVLAAVCMFERVPAYLHKSTPGAKCW